MQPSPRKTKLAIKKNRILNEILRRRSSSRYELAQRLNMNASMVGSYVDEFLHEGLLEETAPSPSGRGRAPRPLRLNGRYGDFLGLDFEALRGRAVLTDFSGRVRLRQEISFEADITRDQVITRIMELAGRLAESSHRLLAVGVAAPGQVDCQSGRILRYELLPDFVDVPIRGHFAREFDVPIVVEDNIRALTHAEMLRGAGRGHRNVLCLAVRSGVGLGIVIDGRLYAGAGSMAGEVGYNVLFDGPQPRRVTDLISAKAVVRQALELLESAQPSEANRKLLQKGSDLSLQDIVQQSRRGDAMLTGLLEQVGRHLGTVVANLANLFSPEKILLTGEVPHCCASVSDTLQETFRLHALPQVLQTTRLDRGVLGGFAAAEGAALLGFSTVFPLRETVLLQREADRRKMSLTL